MYFRLSIAPLRIALGVSFLVSDASSGCTPLLAHPLVSVEGPDCLGNSGRMSSAPKLTKKQKKALAFRERGKGKGKAKSFDELDNDIPVEEDQDRADAALLLADEVSGLETQAGLPKDTKTKDAKAESKSAAEDGKGQGKGKKRKREDGNVEMVEGGEEVVGATPKVQAKKKRKAADGTAMNTSEEGTEDATEKEAKKGKQKFILFVGTSPRCLPLILFSFYDGRY